MNHTQPDQTSLSEDKSLQQARISGDPNILDQLLAPRSNQFWYCRTGNRCAGAAYR
ncbi:hypothetical protein QT397_16740 [Microbulbifer sp. MKSA007]|uniref:hypothetical protein n=1 Tax=Microbulbifer sp. VAAF005 TaxID=3034230 RepID=UPI0024AE01D1|nr:hypothetical protein [Microbulbifer sp. VAAF005]WHI46843.1 hypothetical protein P0078_00275 [Microbulbifer sp. VAAF005]WNZ54536.1 hypothetical protein QT397_16740 [Microbulbifer sp. MKSA007]